MKEFFGIVVFFGLIIAGAIWLPDWWRGREAMQDQRVTISELKKVDFDIQTAKEQSDAAEGEKQSASTKPAETAAAPASDPAKLVLKVLNGGAAGGSAGKAAQVLKTAGFKLTTAGDSKGDYKGTIVYYRSGGQMDAEAVKAALIKSYPGVQTQMATDTKTEQGSAPVVVILGK